LEPAAVGRRLSEMERAGMIEKTGKQRVTPSRRKANVYRIKKQIVN
jgi:predicted transcriptional regulator